MTGPPPIYKLGEADGHHAYLYDADNGEYRARCTCGATWTYQARSTMEHMQSVYESHLKYFTHPKMETL